MDYKNEFYINASNKQNKLRIMMWQPEGAVLGILQISHGMIEHIERYDSFAKYLAKKGFIVVGNDHLGHGKSVANKEEFGYFPATNPSQAVVEDLHQVTLHIKAQYPNPPYFLLGHSMGSFMARRYLMTYGNELDGAIILGTGEPSYPILTLGNLLIRCIGLFKPDTHRSKLANKFCFGHYNHLLKSPRTDHDWLTRDLALVDAYESDAYCNFLFTLNGYQTLLDTFTFIKKPKNIQNIPKDLPILIASGTHDPVGDYGKTVRKIYKCYKNIGLQDITLKLYENARHELLNELNKKQVYEDLNIWLSQYIR